MHELVRHSLKGEVAFVTGAGSGIGRATALLLGFAGARVGALGKNAADLDETCATIRTNGGEALALTADVSIAEQMEGAVKRVREKWGRLDIVVANAGINGLWAPVEEIDPSEWDQTINVNLRGTFLTVKLAVPLLKQQGGSIVIVSSINGTRIFSNAGASTYATSKAGQLAFSRMMALELAAFGIRVNTVCPGSTNTRIGETTRQQNVGKIRPAVVFPNGTVPLAPGKIGTPESVADLIWFLSSPLARHITGTEVYIDGGESLLRG